MKMLKLEMKGKMMLRRPIMHQIGRVPLKKRKRRLPKSRKMMLKLRIWLERSWTQVGNDMARAKNGIYRRSKKFHQ